MYKINYLPQFAQNGTNIEDLRQQIRDARQVNRIERRENRLLNKLNRIQGNENKPVIDENRPATTDGLFSIPYLILNLFSKPFLVRYLESMQPTQQTTTTVAERDLGNTDKTEEDLPLNTPIRIAPVSAKTIETTTVQPVKSDADYKQAVLDVIRGKYGNGVERTTKLEVAGFDPAKVQAAVNAQIKGVATSNTSANTQNTDSNPNVSLKPETKIDTTVLIPLLQPALMLINPKSFMPDIPGLPNNEGRRLLEYLNTPEGKVGLQGLAKELSTPAPRSKPNIFGRVSK